MMERECGNTSQNVNSTQSVNDSVGGNSATQQHRGILKSGGSRTPSSRSGAKLSASDEAASRKSASERARTFLHTPVSKPVNVHQFYPNLENDYRIQPGVVFYDEETEEEEEEEVEAESQILPQGPSQSDERPDSVLTDVTIDGLQDQDVGEMPVQPYPNKNKSSIMSLSTVVERQASAEDNRHSKNFDGDEDGSGFAGQTDDFGNDGIFPTAVDELTLDAARVRMVQDAQTETKNEVTKVLTEKLRSLYSQGLASKSKADYGAAIRAFDKIIVLKPDTVLPYVQRAECFLMTSDLKTAIVNYKKVCSMEPNSELYHSRLAFIYYLQGQTYFDAQMYVEALECFSLSAEIKPNNESCHTRTIACLATLHRHSECLTLLNSRLEHQQESGDLYVMRSRLHLMFKNISSCYYDLKDALAVDPNHAEAKQIMEEFKQEAEVCHATSIQLALQGRHRDALEKISTAIEFDPTQAHYHIIRGALHRQLKDFNAAVEDYLLAMDKADHDESNQVHQDAQRQLLLTYNDFAIECFKKHYFQEAIMLLNKALKGEKSEKGLYVNRGDCFFKCSDFQFALADYHQALELDPRDNSVRVRISVIHNEFGTIEYQNKNYSEAESRFTLAIKNNPRLSHYYLSRARARYMLDNHGGARSDLITSMLLNPNQENVISLASRLFPGKTIEEVMSSEATNTIRGTLTHILSSPSDKKLAPIESGATKESKVKKKVKANYRACLEEEEFNRMLAVEKNMVHEKVKSALNSRKSLRYTGPKLGTRSAGAEKVSAPKTGWRTFTQGISVRDGSS